MIKRIYLPVVFILFVLPSYAQQWKMLRYEIALGVGSTNVYGDLGGAPNATNLLFIKDITFRNTRPSIYTALRYKIDPKMALKFNVIYGYSRNADFNGSRNEMREFVSITNLVEASAQYEFYFLQEERRMRSAAMFNRRGMINNYSTIGAYVFAGIGGVTYWSKLDVEQRPFDTYKPETGFTLALPIGVGIKYVLSDKWMLGWELGYRHTLSDFLDGIQTPWSNNTDVYWVSTLNLSYRIPTSRKGIPIFLDKQWRRARF
jgi:hypothetical protein